jgi:hypothetical protein
MIPFIFSSLAIRAVGQAAMAMVEEVRRQFREIPGIMEGTGKPQYDKCVAISTDASIKKMMAPGALALLSPIAIGFLLGPEALGGMLAGATVSGVLMGMFQSNAGGAWDNAKKSFEKGVDINGQTYFKGSDPHKASVTGDTVGDPFKDTSGPSMNILIKLMSIVSLVIAPTIAGHNLGKFILPQANAATVENTCNMHKMDACHHEGMCAGEMEESCPFIAQFPYDQCPKDSAACDAFVNKWVEAHMDSMPCAKEGKCTDKVACKAHMVHCIKEHGGSGEGHCNMTEGKSECCKGLDKDHCHKGDMGSCPEHKDGKGDCCQKNKCAK